MSAGENHILVGSIVSSRDFAPYVQIDIDGHMVQLNLTEARSVAGDIILLASRAEADAMILRFFKQHDLPQGAADSLMVQFREFRSRIDSAQVERSQHPPKEGA